jgi:hypothetical protein
MFADILKGIWYNSENLKQNASGWFILLFIGASNTMDIVLGSSMWYTIP